MFYLGHSVKRLFAECSIFALYHSVNDKFKAYYGSSKIIQVDVAKSQVGLLGVEMRIRAAPHPRPALSPPSILWPTVKAAPRLEVLPTKRFEKHLLPPLSCLAFKSGRFVIP